MSTTPFHGTRMGVTFFCSTLPGLVTQIGHLNSNIERLTRVLEVLARQRELHTKPGATP